MSPYPSAQSPQTPPAIAPGCDALGRQVREAVSMGRDPHIKRVHDRVAFEEAVIIKKELPRLTIIARGLDLAGIDLSRANLEGTDFSGANLEGANLKWADLNGAIVSIGSTTSTELSLANLASARFESIRVYLDEGIGNSTLRMMQAYVDGLPDLDPDSEKADNSTKVRIRPGDTVTLDREAFRKLAKRFYGANV